MVRRDPSHIAKSHFTAGRVMQLATIRNNVPYVVSVYYWATQDLTSVYWMSEPDRRHSRAIATIDKVAGAIVIKQEQPVIGLQFGGDAHRVTDKDEIVLFTKRYNSKYNNAALGFEKRYAAGIAKHHVYKMSLEWLELFDEANFPGGKPVSVALPLT